MTTDDVKIGLARGWQRFRGFPWWAQLGVVALVVVLGLAAVGKLETVYSHARDWLTDRKLHQAEAERNALRLERDAAIRRAEAAEAQAAVYEEQADALKRVAEDKGLAAREQARKAQEIEDATKVAIERAGADPATARDEYRAALRRLGYLR